MAPLQAFGRVDAVVNHTGHPPKGDLLDIGDEGWAQGNDMMVMSVVRMARLVTPLMLAQGKGAFVNITTFAAFEPSLKFPVSCAYRAAVGAFTKLYRGPLRRQQHPHERPAAGLHRQPGPQAGDGRRASRWGGWARCRKSRRPRPSCCRRRRLHHGAEHPGGRRDHAGRLVLAVIGESA